jgi:hypothetical protein
MSSKSIASLAKKVEGIRLRILALQELQESAPAGTMKDWKKEFAYVLVSTTFGL